MTGFFCPICGKLIDDKHEIKWDGWNHCFMIGCPAPLIVENPLAHCRLDGVEAKDG